MRNPVTYATYELGCPRYPTRLPLCDSRETERFICYPVLMWSGAELRMEG